MAQFAMVIDLQKCTGCSACGLACKTENNTRDAGINDDFKWANFYSETVGQFPNVHWTAYPTLCNHCSDAPCVDACPVNPKAMYKGPNGITLHNEDLCIGCQMCSNGCPYSERDYNASKAQYSVISYNSGFPQPFYRDTKVLIPGCTASPKEVADAVGVVPPTLNAYEHDDYSAVRKTNVTEKCIFCHHRVKEGALPYCVVSCPANARIFGDKNDSNSEVAKLLASEQPKMFKNNKGEFLAAGESGTRPNVYYINSFQSENISSVADKKPVDNFSLVSVYPNPAIDRATIKYTLNSSTYVTMNIYDISGRLILTIHNNEYKGIGEHQYDLNASKLAQGTYLCTLMAGSHTETVNIVISR